MSFLRKPPTGSLKGVRPRSDADFFLFAGLVSALYIGLIAILILADLRYTSLNDFRDALTKPEIQAAFWLTLQTCTVAGVLSIWVAVPLGYLLSRHRFPGHWLVDTLIDIPIVLPPLVLGLSLLILFHLSLNGWVIETWFREDLKFPVSFRWPAVVLAQFAVSCAFAVRTMRVTFDQIDRRPEDVARTLGCTRLEAFFQIALPQSIKGMVAAFTIAWARALGEFGPIIVFAGSTRFRTEVLSTTVFLELSIGNLEAAVAVSLLMVAMAMVILLILRLLGTGVTS